MCLAIPGKIISINTEETEPLMGRVNFGGVIKEVCFDFIPDAKIGEYVMVHVGFALERVNEEEAKKTLDAFAEAEQIIREKESQKDIRNKT
jgi:hydrogenase expression/formation protein HypC